MFNVIVLGIASLLTDISSEMVYPILPVYLVIQLGAGPAALGLIEGVAESTASLLKVFSGFYSDKIKSRKPPTIFGYSASAIGKLLLYISSSWPLVFAARTVDRFGKGVRTAPRDALIAESVPANKRGAGFGLHRALDTLGAAIGVVLAYILVVHYKDGLKTVFLVSFIPAIVGIAFLFFVRESKRFETIAKSKLEFRWSALDKRLKVFLIFTFIFTLGNSSNQFLLLKAKDMGNPLSTVILLYLVYNITYAFSAYPASRLSDKIGRRKLLVSGYIFYGLVYLGFALNRSPGSFWYLFAVYGLYMGFTEGVEKALLTDIAPANLRATTIGLHATLVGIGLFPASLLAGLLWKVLGSSAPFYFGGFIGITSGISLWFILKEGPTQLTTA